MKVLVAQLCSTVCNPIECSLPRLLCPWNSPGKKTGVGSHSLLQEIFSTQRLNLGLLICRHILYYLIHHLFSYPKDMSIFLLRGKAKLDERLSIIALSPSTCFFIFLPSIKITLTKISYPAKWLNIVLCLVVLIAWLLRGAWYISRELKCSQQV